jgi:hypothetical protein
MKKWITFLLIGFSLTSCAQISKTIIKASAYSMIPIPGTIPVNDDGTPMPLPRNVQYSVYLEVKGTPPEWQLAWIGDKQFDVRPYVFNDKKIMIGKRKKDGKQIELKAGNENKLIHLELIPKEKAGKSPKTIKAGQLLLQGKWKGKTISHSIPEIIELASPEYQ